MPHQKPALLPGGPLKHSCAWPRGQAEVPSAFQFTSAPASLRVFPKGQCPSFPMGAAHHGDTRAWGNYRGSEEQLGTAPQVSTNDAWGTCGDFSVMGIVCTRRRGLISQGDRKGAPSFPASGLVVKPPRGFRSIPGRKLHWHEPPDTQSRKKQPRPRAPESQALMRSLRPPIPAPCTRGPRAWGAARFWTLPGGGSQLWVGTYPAPRPGDKHSLKAARES